MTTPTRARRLWMHRAVRRRRAQQAMVISAVVTQIARPKSGESAEVGCSQRIGRVPSRA